MRVGFILLNFLVLSGVALCVLPFLVAGLIAYFAIDRILRLCPPAYKLWCSAKAFLFIGPLSFLSLMILGPRASQLNDEELPLVS